mgnify:CR=1 FL=1
MKTLLIAGGTGFLGTHISREASNRGYRVVRVSRSAPTSNADVIPWSALPEAAEGASAIINLAGSNLAKKRWSASERREILRSRVETTRSIVGALAQLTNCPPLINASAVGYYGNTMVPSSEAMPSGQTFLANVVKAWEAEAERARKYTRVALLRVGVVLDPNEGAFPKLALPMKLFVGGVPGNGRQWMPWVHRDDVVHAFLWAVENQQAAGPYNVVAPECVPMSTFISEMAHVLRRPAIAPVPAALLRLVLGKKADVILHGQNVVPSRLLGEQFRFAYPLLRCAIESLVK